MPLRRFKPNLRVSRERRLSGSNQQQQQSKPSSSATACSGADPAVLSPEEVNSSPLATEEPTQPTEQSPTNTATITSAINTEPSVATSSDSDRSEKILSAAPIRDSHVSQPLSMTSSESARGVKVQRVRRRIAPLVPSRTRVARRGERPVSNSCLSPLSSPNQPLDREGSLDTAEHSDRASSPFSPSQHPPRTTDCAESFGPPPPSSSSTELTAVDTCSAPVRGLTSPGIHSSDSTHDIQSSSTVGQCSSVPAQPVEDGEEDSLEPKTTHRGGRRGSRGRRRSSQSVSVGEGGGGEGGRGRGESSSRMGGTRQTTAAKRGRGRGRRRTRSTTQDDRAESPAPKRRRRGRGRGRGRRGRGRDGSSVQSFREAPDRSTMTMQDLIYYNPSSNPMSKAVDERRRKTSERAVSPTSSSAALSPRRGLADHGADEACGRGGGGGGGGRERRSDVDNEDDDDDEEEEQEEEEEEGRIVPALRIGADGSIQVDEKSMTVEKTHRPLDSDSEVVMEEGDYTTSTSFRQRHKIKKWTREETGKFFKALSQVGTDFTMMTLLIPKRSRKELKNKFKKEEKSNPTKVTEILSKLCGPSSPPKTSKR